MRLTASFVLCAALACVAVPAHAGFSSSGNYGKVPSARAPVFVGSSPNVPQPSSPVSVHAPSGPAIDWDLGAARERISDARRAGVISRQEARQLRREADVLDRHAEVYARDGLTESEANELHARSLYLMGMATAPNRPRQ